MPLPWLLSLPRAEEMCTDKAGNSRQPQGPGACLPASCGPYPSVRLDVSRLLIAVVTLTGLCFSSSVNEILSSWKTFRLFLFREVGKDPRIAAQRSVQANKQPSRDFASWKALGPHQQALKFLCKTNSSELGRLGMAKDFVPRVFPRSSCAPPECSHGLLADGSCSSPFKGPCKKVTDSKAHPSLL